jgi:hypothetical protein
MGTGVLPEHLLTHGEAVVALKQLKIEKGSRFLHRLAMKARLGKGRTVPLEGDVCAAAEEFAESATELQSAWQDKYAGEDWLKISRILQSAADKIEQVIA